MKKHIVALLVFVVCSSLAKVRFMTAHYNRPDFIELQYKSLKKYLKNDFELIVFSDSPTTAMQKKMEAVCAKYDIQFIQYDQSMHHDTALIHKLKQLKSRKDITGFRELGDMLGTHPSVRHCNVMQYAMENYGHNHDDIVCIIDGDMFLVRDFDIRQSMRGYDFIGTGKHDETGNCKYMWIALSMFKPNQMPNIQDLSFSLDLMENKRMGDSGSATYNYLQSNPSVQCKYMDRPTVGNLRNKSDGQLKRLGFTSEMQKMLRNAHDHVEFHMDYHFIHFGRSSFDWDPGYKVKNQCFMNSVHEVI